MAGSRRKRTTDDAPEVLPPEEPVGMSLRIDAAYLVMVARNARRLQVDPLMATVMKQLKRDAAYGMMSSVITLNMESWRAVPLLSEISDRLIALGFQTKAAMKEPTSARWGDAEQPVLHVVWGGVR